MRRVTAPSPTDSVETTDSMSAQPFEERAVFVPAIMSVGILFSIATLVRDAIRWTGGRARDRRTAIEARLTVSEICGDGPPPYEELGLLSRRSYLLTALLLLGGATYIAIGSAANFLRDGGYVADIAWLLAISLGLAALLFFLAGVAFAVFTAWPNPPAWTLPSLRAAPLTATPGRGSIGPSWARTAALLGLALFTGLLSLFVGSGRSIVDEIDQPIYEWLAETEGLERLETIDPFGSTVFSILLVSLIGLSVFRCRVMALAYPLAFALSWNTTMLLRNVIDRSRPNGAGLATSFPSGHMVQATFIAGLLPLALFVLLGDRRLLVLTRTIFASLVVLTALHRIHDGRHWPMDALGGVALGLCIVVGVQWVLEHERWHSRCGSCPWSGHPSHVDWSTGVVRLSPRATTLIGRLGVFAALTGALVLAAATVSIGIPSDPEGDGLGATIAEPVQVGFAVLLAIAGLLAIRWKATAAALMALSAMGIGLSASIEYEPYVAMSMAALLLIPCVLTWLAWQPNETIGSIARLLAITLAVMTAVGVGSSEIYDHYFGPTHPESSTPSLVSDATWLWLGDVETRTATVVAAGFVPDSRAAIGFWRQPTGSTGEPTMKEAPVDQYGLARFELSTLEPDTRYGYSVINDPDEPLDADDLNAASSFTTHAEGPQDLVVAIGACARRGSNGAVFDQIVEMNPDLYLAVGDMHYGSVSSGDPEDHLREYGVALRQPAQSQLFRSIPTAYIWDDHDYGPNDAGADSPSRAAVANAYRAAVPHYGVSENIADPIAQAFTIGRVRFILTDTRSQRTENSMLGPDQLAWFIDEVRQSSRDHALVVWANPTPWITETDSSEDDWSTHAPERQVIADALVEYGIDNLVMVSGDAHMLAIDDGTNSGYSENNNTGFPLLQAAALDRPGSSKGGPYSEGAFPGGGQFGLLEIEDDGGAVVHVELSGHDWEGNEIVSFRTSFEVSPN